MQADDVLGRRASLPMASIGRDDVLVAKMNPSGTTASTSRSTLCLTASDSTTASITTSERRRPVYSRVGWIRAAFWSRSRRLRRPFLISS